MNCPKCKTENIADAKICMKCGNQFIKKASPAVQPKSMYSEKKKSRKWIIWLLSLAIICSFVAGGIELIPAYRIDKYHRQANAYSEKGDYDNAIANYNKAIELNPESSRAAIYYNRGIAYSKKNDFDRAIADYNKAIEINPNDAEIYFNRGGAYYRKGDIDKAISDTNKASEIDPKDAYSYYRLACLYSLKNNDEEEIGRAHV